MRRTRAATIRKDIAFQAGVPLERLTVCWWGRPRPERLLITVEDTTSEEVAIIKTVAQQCAAAWGVASSYSVAQVLGRLNVEVDGYREDGCLSRLDAISLLDAMLNIQKD